MDVTNTASSLQVEAIAYGLIQVRITSPPVSSECKVSVNKWSGTAVNPVVSLSSSDCVSPMMFNYTAFGNMFEFDEDYVFALQGLSAGKMISCETAPSIFTLAAPSCNLNLVIKRPDSVSLSAAITGVDYKLGECHVSLIRYNSFVMETPIVEKGACNSDFIFESDRKNISLSNGAAAEFSWSYVPDKQTAICSAPHSTVIDPITAPTCYQGLSIEKTLGFSFFIGIAQPKPLEGTCSLGLVSCDQSSAVSGIVDIIFPSCSQTAEVSFDIIQALHSSALPGRTCTFSWKYSYGLDMCVSTLTVTTPPLRSRCSLEAAASVGLATIDVTASGFTTLVGSSCQVALLACDGTSLALPVIKSFTSCAIPETLSFSAADWPLIKTDSSCILQLKQVPVGESFSTSVHYACDSGPLTFSASGTPSWLNDPSETSVTLISSDCLELYWDAPVSSGGSPILCFQVYRRDSGDHWYLIQDCGGGKVGSRRVVSCGFVLDASIEFKTVAINRNGACINPLINGPFYIESLLVAPASTIIVPSTVGPFRSASFPVIQVQSRLQTLGPAGFKADSTTNSKLFVASLLERCKIDPESSSVTLPLEPGDTGYVAGQTRGPVPIMQKTMEADPGQLGRYRLVVQEPVGRGDYSLVVSSLEGGGLRGQYWGNAFLHGVPDIERKDRKIAFDWGQGPLINATSVQIIASDLVSARWTGFIRPSTEDYYTIRVETLDHFRMWVNGEILMDFWETACGGVCTASVEIEDVANIRIDFYHTKGFDQAKVAKFILKWSSYTLPLEVIPTKHLFFSTFIAGGVFPSISVVPDELSSDKAVVELPIDPVVAGIPSALYVQGKDVLGQNTTSSSDAFLCVLTLTPSGGAVHTVSSVPADISVANGRYILPFTLTTSGSYKLDITDASGGIINTTGMRIAVSPADAYTTDSVVVPAAKIAGVPGEVSMQVKDAFGNFLNGNFVNPNVKITATWIQDPLDQERLGPNHNDILNRTRVLGNSFTNLETQWDNTVSKFVVPVTITLAGQYAVQLSVVGSGATPMQLAQWTVQASHTADPATTVVVSKPFPPTYLIAGVSETITVQLRDVYGNSITGDPSGLWASAPVKIQLVKPPFIHEESVCTPVVATKGSYRCSITPSGADEGIQLSILTNNNASSVYIPDQSSGSVAPVRGPWEVQVNPAAIDGTKSVIRGLLASYFVGYVGDASTFTLSLRDAFSNIITDLHGYLPIISLTFRRSDNSVVSTTTATYAANQDGTLAVKIFSLAPTPSNPADPDFAGWTLELVVDGLLVPTPGGARVRFMSGFPSAVSTVCSLDTDTVVAGTPFATTCDIKDKLGNSMDYSGLHLFTRFMASGFAEQNFLSAHQPGGSYTGSSQITVAGIYDVATELLQPGSLIGFYFSRSDFTNLIFTGSLPITDGYTVFSKLEEGLSEIDYVGANSIRWVGYLKPPTVLPVRFFVRADGGVRISMNSAVIFNLISADSVDASFDYSFVSSDLVPITIEFIRVGAVNFSLKWRYPDFAGQGFHIPRSLLLAPLRTILSPSKVIVNPGIISGASLVIGPTDPVVFGNPEIMVIEARDMYGNKIIMEPDCLHAGGLLKPDCLFEIDLEQADGTPSPAIAYVGDGQYKVEFLFATVVPKRIHFRLITGPNAGDRVALTGSSVSVTLTP